MMKPIVLCGLGRMGWRVLEDLRTAGLDVVVIDTICRLGDSRLGGARLVSGDCRKSEVLAEAGVAGASGVLIMTADDLVNLTTALAARALNQNVRIVLRMYNQNLLERLGKTLKNVYALSTSLLVAPVLAQTAVTGQGLGTFRLNDSTAGFARSWKFRWPRAQNFWVRPSGKWSRRRISRRWPIFPQTEPLASCSKSTWVRRW